MIPIKIQCGCGQRYAFDVEPVDGRMPYSVACPVCGVDGTEAANIIIAQVVAAQPEAQPVVAGGVDAPTRLRVAVRERASASGGVATAEHSPASRVATKDFTSARNEARSKVYWGDAPEDVTRFLMMQGMPAQEARAVVRKLSSERARAVRGGGIQKILSGCGLVCVPIASLIIFLRIGVVPLWLFGFTVAIGLWGVWRVFKGTMMVLAPRMEPGDVADM